MRDDRDRWRATGAATQFHDLSDATLTPVVGLQQTLMSGPGVLRTGAGGWPEVVSGETYRVALRRDRVLAVGETPTALGWDADKKVAASDASALYAVFDLAGPGAFDLIKRGTEISLATPSRSVLRLFFGLEVCLYRRAETEFRIHIGAAQAEAFVHLLQTAHALRAS